MSKTFYEGYEILETLGQGSFGKVKLASRDGDLFAIKFSSENNAYSHEILQRIFLKETNIIAGLNHPNIIKLYGSYMQGEEATSGMIKHKAGIIFEYAPHNLGEIMELGALEEPVARTLFKQMLDGISYLHSNNIIHRDIKPENILFDQNFNVKICDFGLSTRVDTSNKPKTICGSDSFKSPEVLLRKNYNGVMNDLFAAGVTLFILVSGHAPFVTAAPHAGQYQFIALNYFDKFWKVHEKKSKYSPEFKDLINSMLAFDPTYRLSIPEILSHPWMNQDVLMGDELQQVMRNKVVNIVQNRKNLVMKQMKTRNPKTGRKKINRTGSQLLEKQPILAKYPYHKQTAKLTDRFVPKINNFADLEELFSDINAELRTENGTNEITKIFQEEKELTKIVVSIRVDEIDEQYDCLRFTLVEGYVGGLVQFLRQFDTCMLQE